MYVERYLTDEQIERLRSLADRSPPPSEDNSAAGALIIGGTLAVMFILMFFSGQRASYLWWALLYLRGHVSELPFQLLFLLMVLAIAGTLYALRSKMRRVYGAVEVCAGSVTALTAANHIYDSLENQALSNVLATLAGIYIIIRGFDNWNYKPLLLPASATSSG